MEQEKSDLKPPLLISLESLNEQTLHAVLESYILREGTDYGAVEISLEQKVFNLRKKIDRHDFVLVFDPETESLNILTQRDWQRNQQKMEDGT